MNSCSWNRISMSDIHHNSTIWVINIICSEKENSSTAWHNFKIKSRHTVFWEMNVSFKYCPCFLLKDFLVRSLYLRITLWVTCFEAWYLSNTDKSCLQWQFSPFYLNLFFIFFIEFELYTIRFFYLWRRTEIACDAIVYCKLL